MIIVDRMSDGANFFLHPRINTVTRNEPVCTTKDSLSKKLHLVQKLCPEIQHPGRVILLYE